MGLLTVAALETNARGIWVDALLAPLTVFHQRVRAARWSTICDSTMLRFASLIGVALLGAACGGSSTSPAPPDPPLPDGGFELFVAADPVACHDVQSSPVGTLVLAEMTATHDAAGTWIAHASTPQSGSVEIRLTRGPNVTQAPDGPARPADVSVTDWLAFRFVANATFG
jgi:hypothetical protein